MFTPLFRATILIINSVPLLINYVTSLEGIILLLDSTFLQFNNKYYKQIMDAPMGFCSSPWFADISLELLETLCLENYNKDVLLYKRYVDDCLLIVKKEKIEEILCSFNSYNKYLQFTIEWETNNSINFLDLQLIRTNNKIITNWFRQKNYFRFSIFIFFIFQILNSIRSSI